MIGIDLDALKWLTQVPTGDGNFTWHLKAANAETIRAALDMVPANHKAKVKALEAHLRKLEKGEGMAPKKEPRAHDVEAEAANQIYQVAQAEMQTKLTAMREEMDSVRVESFGMGSIKAFDANIAQNEFFKIMTMYRIKLAKDYKAGGLTWVEFCDAVGVPQRTADRMIEEAKPLFESFSAIGAEICGLPFNKIRLLGKSISGNLAEIKDNCLVYGDESIPLTPEYRDDIQALIERIGEEAKEKVEEAEAQLSAKDKVLKGKTDLLNKQERALKKFEKEAASKGLTVDEDAFLQLMFNKRTAFDGYMLSTDPDFVMENAGEVTPRMRAALISTLQYMKMQMLVSCETAVTHYGADMAPEVMEEFEDWFKQQEMAVPK